MASFARLFVYTSCPTSSLLPGVYVWIPCASVFSTTLSKKLRLLLEIKERGIMSGGLKLAYPKLYWSAFWPPFALLDFLKANAHPIPKHTPQRSLVEVTFVVTQDYNRR